MNKLAANYILNTLEIMEQNLISQIRALRGLVLAAKEESQKEIVNSEAKSVPVTQRDIEAKLSEWLEDQAGMEFGGIDGIEHVQKITRTDA